MTDQELFDKVATHLLTQKMKSLLPGTNNMCAYRGKAGRTCAIGCLIPDDKYDLRFEGASLDADTTGVLLDAAGLEVSQRGLAMELQEIHDTADVSEWKDELRRVAQDCNLSEDVLD